MFRPLGINASVIFVWQEKGSTYMILHLFCTRGRNQFIILRTVRNIKILIFPLPNWVYYCLCQMCLQDHSRPLSTKILQNNVIIKNYSFYNAHFWEISNTFVDCVKKPNSKILTTQTQTMETFTFVVSCPQDIYKSLHVLYYLDLWHFQILFEIFFRNFFF